MRSLALFRRTDGKHELRDRLKDLTCGPTTT